MKKALFVALVLLMVLAATDALAQRNYEVITVKGLEVNSGVVMLTIQQGNTSFQLQCNANVPGCYTLPPGSYVMVRLPKTWGTYVCGMWRFTRRRFTRRTSAKNSAATASSKSDRQSRCRSYSAALPTFCTFASTPVQNNSDPHHRRRPRSVEP